MNNKNVKFILASKNNISEYIKNCSWVISVGSFKYDQKPLFRFIPDQLNIQNNQPIEFIQLSKSKGVTMIPSESAQHTTGVFDNSKSAMKSISGESGALIFGPYISMSKGKYIARLRYSSVSTRKESVGNFDVNGYMPINKSGSVLNNVPISPSAKITSIELPFTVKDESSQMEFRVWVNGKYEKFYLYGIEVFEVDG
jgi:hypothetical protein